MSEKKDFFISYNQADRRWAEWIAWYLEEEGYTTVIQAWDFQPGSNSVGDGHPNTQGVRRNLEALMTEMK